MLSLLQDARYAVRSLANHRTFTLVALLTLALGIGATAAIFSVVDAALLRPLPFADAERIVVLKNTYAPFSRVRQARPDMIDWEEQGQLFTSVAAYVGGGANLTGGDEPTRIRIAQVTPNLLAMLGVRPAPGRAFLPEERNPGHDVALLGHGLWQRQFGGTKDAVGKTIALNGTSYTIVGIMPPQFSFPERSELWLPFAVPVDMRRLEMFPEYHRQTVVGRLRPGLSMEGAQTLVDAIAARYRQGKPAPEPDARVTLLTLREHLLGKTRPALLILMGAVALLLLIACANVANLLLTRASIRRKEIALRAVLGATRARLVRQLLTESTLLALGGSVLGLLIAFASVRLLRTLGPAGLVGVAPIEVDGRVLGFSLVAALATSLLFGLAPAIGSTRLDLGESLKGGGGPATRSADAGKLRGALVVIEVALALVLLIGAGPMLKSFRRLLAIDSGVNPESVVTMELSLPRAAYGRSRSAAGIFFDQVLERVRTLPGVRAAGAISNLPLGGRTLVDIPVQIEGRSRESMRGLPLPQHVAITSGYFRVLGISIVAGRDLAGGDRAGAPPVAVINQALANAYWPNESAVGKGLRLPYDSVQRTVVGVVRDVRGHTLEQKPEPQIYVPEAQSTSTFMTIAVRAAADPDRIAASVRAVVRTVDPALPISNVQTMRDVVAASVAPRRSNTLLLGLFGALAMTLAGLGVYGIMAYSVAQRTHEIGIRIALGAQLGDVLSLVVRQGIGLTTIGVGVGLFGAWALTRVLRSQLYGVSPTDPWMFASVPLALFGVSLLASYLPARRAARVDPAVALRDNGR